MKIILVSLLISLQIMSLQAFARIKEVGGGSGAGGTLTDRQVYGQGQLLDGLVLLRLVQARFKHEFTLFPELSVLSARVLIDAHRKSFYLDSRALPAACRNQPAVGVPVEAWACQDFASVRIDEATWKKLDDTAKADLIFHEVLTSVALLNPNMDQTFAYVSAAFGALVNSGATVQQIQTEWLRIGFGYLPDANEWKAAGADIRSFTAAVCVAKSAVDRDIISFDRAAQLRSGAGSPSYQLWLGQTYLAINSDASDWMACDVLNSQIGEYLWKTWYTQMASSPASGDMYANPTKMLNH